MVVLSTGWINRQGAIYGNIWQYLTISGSIWWLILGTEGDQHLLPTRKHEMTVMFELG
ncbi:uncharacterized protein ASCRUDRAFT_75878 [Ascoidea rubescens DSM 1968]|uniref:Uncharacterized protein n=1 Tax=Ascoidea rubescens DSM 1968 TaxID=1344418 RepID=A0A1D2VHQ2_9ASCO|nr:hypothetical protein ASCRUDRAFT_75878 [Ascoidea rubescens DSM 1968]ODV61166.1 hypothetical protein ASCRUDRAFT_75878 [Ascoidea rubescens DSM 1968]